MHDPHMICGLTEFEGRVVCGDGHVVAPEVIPAWAQTIEYKSCAHLIVQQQVSETYHLLFWNVHGSAMGGVWCVFFVVGCVVQVTGISFLPRQKRAHTDKLDAAEESAMANVGGGSAIGPKRIAHRSRAALGEAIDGLVVPAGVAVRVWRRKRKGGLGLGVQWFILFALPCSPGGWPRGAAKQALPYQIGSGPA